MLKSEIVPGAPVTFPPFIGERIYMQPFVNPSDLPQRWRLTAEQMLTGVYTDKTKYLMVDEKSLRMGKVHRRPGIHVEGNWDPVLNDHRGGHRHAHYDPELVILAASHRACAAYLGEFDDLPGEGGDCQHFDLSKAQKIILRENRAYVGTATTLHESIQVYESCKRTVVRINIPGVTFQ